jgi:hypothetical protein
MDQPEQTPNSPRRNEDIALDLLKFVAASAGLGKGPSPAAGFVAGASSKSEEQVSQLLSLYSKCLTAVQGK